MRKFLLVVVWFPMTFTLLLVNLLLLSISTSQRAQAKSPNEALTNQGVHHVAASEGSSRVSGTSVVAGDARGPLLRSFLENYQSPMAPYAELIVEEADQNGLDFRLLVAIAMCESNLGKKMPRSDSFNPFGIAVYGSDQAGKRFDSWEHAITWVSRYIRQMYYERGIRDLKAIGAIWAPPSVENGYSWTNCVESFQSKIF